MKKYVTVIIENDMCIKIYTYSDIVKYNYMDRVMNTSYPVHYYTIVKEKEFIKGETEILIENILFRNVKLYEMKMKINDRSPIFLSLPIPTQDLKIQEKNCLCIE